MARGFVLVWTIVIGIFLAAACAETENDQTESAPKQVSILYFNDFHGHLLPFHRFYGDSELSGGLARMAYLVKKIKYENAQKGIDTILVSAGDNVQGTPISTAFSGEVEVRAFNKMGLDATVAGNHDFDFGTENLLNLSNIAKFSILSANVYEIAGSKLIFPPYQVIQTNNRLRIGLIGLSTPETPITTHPLNVQSLRFTRPDLAMQRYYDTIDRETDVIIILSHLGIDVDREIARAYPGVDVVIGGHTHTLLADPIYMGEVMICSAGDRGLYLGRLDLEIREDRASMITNQLLSIGPHIPEDPQVKAVIEKYANKLDAEISRVVGSSSVFLDGERDHIRQNETNLGDFIADLMRLRTDSDVALINSGAIRASIEPGEVTLEDLMRAFPMNNEVVTMDLSGQELYLVLSRSIKGLLASSPSKLFGGFLQESGLEFSLKDGKPYNIRVNGRALNLYRVYRVATVDFLSVGGDGYRELKEGKEKYNTGIKLQDLAVDYLKKHGAINAQTDGRMKL